MRKYSKKSVSFSVEFVPFEVESDNQIWGGLKPPKHISELVIEAKPEFDFDLMENKFVPTGKLNLNVTGTPRALRELGKYLVNLSYYKTNDSNFHEHLDGFSFGEDGTPIELIFHKPIANKSRKD